MKLQELINTIVCHVVFSELYLNVVQKVIRINKAFILKGKSENCSPAECRTWLFPGKALSPPLSPTLLLTKVSKVSPHFLLLTTFDTHRETLF